MGYATDFHELLVANMIRILGNFVRGTNCRVYGSNRPVFIPGQIANYNPDVLVVCGETQLQTYRKTMNATLNPALVVEVLSKTTQEFDFVEKSANYKKISTLQYYLLIAQYECRVELYSRPQMNIDLWTYQVFEDINDVITFPALNMEFNLLQIYEGIGFS